MTRNLINQSYILLYFLLGTFLLQGCGGEGNDSSKIDISQIATKPTVINSNFTIDPTPSDSDSGDEIEVVGPWFAVRFAGSNPTTRTLTIASFTVESFGRTQDGTETKSEWVPDLQNATIIREVAAGEDFEEDRIAYVDNLPENRTKSWRVRMTFEGWFNKIDDPETTIDESGQPDESFSKTISFTTQ